MSDVQSIFRQNDPFEQLVNQIIESESTQLREVEQRKAEQEQRQAAVSDAGSKLSSLSSTVTDFRNPMENMFNPLNVTSTNENAFDLTIDEMMLDEPADYDINVNNVAQRDIVLSDTIDNEGDDLTGDTIEMDITVGENTRNIEVDASDAENNLEVMNMVVSEINEQFDDVESGLQANVFNVDGQNSQISIKSDETGSDNRVEISGGGDFGFDHHIDNEEDLNAQFTVDGVDFTRQTNTVDDVIDGVSVELLQETGNERISVVRDQEQAMENVENFIGEFNEVNSYIREQTFLDGESGERGPLQRDRVFRTLMQDLRLEMSAEFGAGLSEEEKDELPDLPFDTLMEIGINFQQNGEMYIEDQAQLEDALQANPDEVQELFANPDGGILNRVEDRIDDFVSGSGSVINSLENTIDQRVEHYESRVEREESRLETRRDQLREEFTEMQQVMIDAQNQMQNMQAIQGQMGGAEQMMMMQ